MNIEKFYTIAMKYVNILQYIGEPFLIELSYLSPCIQIVILHTEIRQLFIFI